MIKRILMVVMTAAMVTTSTGCTPFRNFFFGRGAQCGLCTRLREPFQRQTPPPQPPCSQPTCNTPTYIQPQYPAQAADCGCGPATYGSYGVASPCGESCDPYAGAVGNGVIYGEGQPIYGGSWVPAPTDSQGYRSNYMGYPDTGARFDRDGARIIHEDPLPQGASAVN